MSDRQSKIRLLLFQLLILAAFLVIIFRLWDLQIISADVYQRSADRNRFRLVPISAPRGIIYDRYGQMLVRNVPSFTVSIIPAGLPDDPEERSKVLHRVSELTGVPVGIRPESGVTVAEQGRQQPTIEGILYARTTGPFAVNPYSAIRIASKVDRQAAFLIEEEHLNLPGVQVEAVPLRQYLDGSLTAHILGYVGAIPSEALSIYIERGYVPDDPVGLMGIERTQESLLSGVKGSKHIEVNVFERQVALIASQPPVQGHSIVLTLDLKLQREVERALREGMRSAGSEVGVAVVMDPRTGEVLAMASLPAYDNNLFSGGISYADYAALSTDPNYPLINHAIGGQYAPGSTFKIISAAAVLEEGVVHRNSTVSCTGTMWLPHLIFPNDPRYAQPFRCWNLGGHGALNVVGAIRQSCNIFFYQVVGGFREQRGLGVEGLARYASMFGFGEPTGIELAGEVGGLLPSERWKRQTYGEVWYTGDSYNAAIGQGYILGTPMQMLNATVAVANGGTLYRPQLVRQVIDAEGKVVKALTPDPIRKVDVHPEYLALIGQGMREAVTFGTAWRARLPGVAVAGKTGSAEYLAFDEHGNAIVNERGYLPTHAWFVAYAPYEDPEIALVVFLAGGGEGSEKAAPVAADILRTYFDLMPTDP
jgi:penicillin-binding protein 2